MTERFEILYEGVCLIVVVEITMIVMIRISSLRDKETLELSWGSMCTAFTVSVATIVLAQVTLAVIKNISGCNLNC